MVLHISQVDLQEDGYFDYPAIEEALNKRKDQTGNDPAFQRISDTDQAILWMKIGELIAFIKERSTGCNLYGGQLLRGVCGGAREPSDVGADMIVGSLIKNPGGGLAPIGGYIAGKEESDRKLRLPPDFSGTWKRSWSIPWSDAVLSIRDFSLPRLVVCGALKGAIFAANVYEKLGFPVDSKQNRIHDMISFRQSHWEVRKVSIAFCQGIQAAAPVDSYVTPESVGDAGI